MNTPWGKSDSKTNYLRGVSFVGTPGHGGFAVTSKAAHQYLTAQARAKAEFRNGYFFFEEDCDAFIVMLEIPQTRDQYSEDKIVESLSHWHADYLIERGIAPEPQAYEWFKMNRLEDQMRKEKNPELVVAAFGDWHKDCPKGSVLVSTADGKQYLVPSAEYGDRGGKLNVLSNYSNVQAVTA